MCQLFQPKIAGGVISDNFLILEGCGKLWLRYFILWYNGHIKWEDVDNYVDSVDNPLFG